jgi:hypothetical protein
MRMLALSILLSAVVTAFAVYSVALGNRYELRPHNANTLLRLDRWTGETAVCVEWGLNNEPGLKTTWFAPDYGLVIDCESERAAALRRGWTPGYR